jgi:hypothetical protein
VLAWPESRLPLELHGVQAIDHRLDHAEDDAVQCCREQDLGPTPDLSITSGISPLPVTARQSRPKAMLASNPPTTPPIIAIGR